MTQSDTTPTLQPRAALALTPEYHPPLSGRTGLRLDFNENTHSPSPRVLARLRTLTPEDLTRYPERDPAERYLAAHFQLAPEQVLLTNGVDEAIHLLAEAYLDPGDEAIIVVPTFAMYEVNARGRGATVCRIASPSDFSFPCADVLAAINKRTRLIVIASPNNPTGAVVPREQILAIAAAAPQAAILADEAYYHFHGDTVMADIGRTPNLFLARTFSKVYGLAGLRLGVIAGSAEAMRSVRKVCSPYNVNAVALACLEPAVEDHAHTQWYVDQVHTGRRHLESALAELGVTYWPSHANFVLTHIGPQHMQFVHAMRTRGVLVRDRSADPGCAGCVRISVGTIQHTQAGIAAMREALKDIQWRSEE